MMRDSRLPVHIKRDGRVVPHSRCFCSQLRDLMSQQTFIKKGHSMTSLKNKSAVIQTEPLKKSVETQSLNNITKRDSKANCTNEKCLTEVHKLLENINVTVESILSTLQDKKDELYIQSLLENHYFNAKPHKRPKNKTKFKDPKTNNAQCKMMMPENSVSFLCLPKAFMEQSLGINYPIVLPRTYSFLYNYKPSSCPDINYFQMLGKMVDPKINGTGENQLLSVTVSSRQICDNEISSDYEDAK